MKIKNYLPLGIFFGLIVLSLIILYIVNTIANKFLHGDFIKVTGEESDEEEVVELLVKTEVGEEEEEEKEKGEKEDEVVVAIEEEEQEQGERRPRSEPSPYQTISKKAAMLKIKGEGFESSFASNAKINVSLEYQTMSKCIIGCVRTIEGLSTDKGGPDLVCFHIKILPSRKPMTKTQWKHSSTKMFALSFTLGPLKDNCSPDSFVCMRLYGKKRKTGVPREKCYGECSVPLSLVLETDGAIELTQKLLPKADKVDIIKSTTKSKSVSPISEERKEATSSATAASTVDVLSDQDEDVDKL